MQSSHLEVPKMSKTHNRTEEKLHTQKHFHGSQSETLTFSETVGGKEKINRQTKKNAERAVFKSQKNDARTMEVDWTDGHRNKRMKKYTFCVFVRMSYERKGI